jgi:hypothetical protein
MQGYVQTPDRYYLIGVTSGFPALRIWTHQSSFRILKKSNFISVPKNEIKYNYSGHTVPIRNKSAALQTRRDVLKNFWYRFLVPHNLIDTYLYIHSPQKQPRYTDPVNM